MKIIHIPMAIMAACLLAACSTVAPPAPPAGDVETATLLSSAMKRAEALPSGTSSADAKMKPAVMDGAISINYAGDAKDLLKQMSAVRGKTFSVRGPQPYLPLFVMVDVKGVSFEEFLTDVGSQLGQRADLVLTNNTIEVRYRGQ